tara:strand:+ start:431 stop:2440 length:2010 start_codon:yes stop_codon:yes gene_type:complete
MCFVCSRSAGFETDIGSIIGISKTPKLEINHNLLSTPTPPNTLSNGNQYTFTIVGLDKSSSLYDGIYLNSVRGIEYIATKFKWKGTLDFVAKYEPNPPSNWNATDPKNNSSDRGFGGYGSYQDEAIYEITTGIDRNPGNYDVGSWIFPSPDSSTKLYNYTDEVFIDPNPVAEDDSTIPSGTNDYFSIFIHESFHGMGVNEYNASFNKLIKESNGKNYFTGEASVAYYGEDLELSRDKNHYSLNAKNGELYDLMGWTNDYTLYEKNRWSITKLDQALYGDLGYGIILDGDNTDENYIGGLGDDVINTFGGDDIIKGRSGDDKINGGEGSDKVIFLGEKSNYTITEKQNNTIEIKDNSGSDGTDTLSNIEYLQFTDQTLVISADNTVIVDIQGSNTSETIISSAMNENIDGLEGNDTVIYSGKFSDYCFTRKTDSIKIADKITGLNDGIDSLSNIEYLQFADQTIEESKLDIVKTFKGEFSDVKFYNKGNGTYEIGYKYGNLIKKDDITGFPLLRFLGEAPTSAFREISAIADIKGTFDQVTGLYTKDAKMFRLYNAAFKRLPDPDGLRYWISKYSSGENDERAVASSFLVSDEFKQRYGENITHETYVENLYLNVLNRELDQGGYDYWVGNLNNGIEQRHEVLLGFSESAENRMLFAEMTGYYKYGITVN